MPKPTPLEAIRFRLEQKGMSELELSEILGHRSRKSEILSGKRKLSSTMSRKLNEILHIPAEVLIQSYYQSHQKRCKIPFRFCELSKESLPYLHRT